MSKRVLIRFCGNAPRELRVSVDNVAITRATLADAQRLRGWPPSGGWNPWQYNVRLTKPTSDSE